MVLRKWRTGCFSVFLFFSFVVIVVVYGLVFVYCTVPYWLPYVLCTYLTLLEFDPHTTPLCVYDQERTGPEKKKTILSK